MKKEMTIKYPHSATLFQFCRRVLDHKFGGIRVIDQDVGQILGFDPADCSHWKKGKKNIRSIHAMRSIADHLDVDEKLVVDVASGEMTATEAYFEYAGYGATFVDPKVIDLAKKDYYRRHTHTWSRDMEMEFKAYFSIDEQEIDRVVDHIHRKIDFKEAPLYLPEIVAAFPHLKLQTDDSESAKSSESTPFPVRFRQDSEVTEISYPADIKMKPYIRYQIAKCLSRSFLVDKSDPPRDMASHFEHIHEVQANIFATKLLTPGNLVKKELANLNVAKDIVSQLAEVFWVSKTLMNRRLKEILQSTSPI